MLYRLTGDEEQVGGFDLLYKNNKRVKKSSKNDSFLGCFNDREKQIRKMAKLTALRLAEKPKKDEKPPERKGRSLVNGVNNPNANNNTAKNIPNSFYRGKPV